MTSKLPSAAVFANTQSASPLTLTPNFSWTPFGLGLPNLVQDGHRGLDRWLYRIPDIPDELPGSRRLPARPRLELEPHLFVDSSTRYLTICDTTVIIPSPARKHRTTRFALVSNHAHPDSNGAREPAKSSATLIASTAQAARTGRSTRLDGCQSLNNRTGYNRPLG